jgi:hypothetical protein
MFYNETCSWVENWQARGEDPRELLRFLAEHDMIETLCADGGVCYLIETGECAAQLNIPESNLKARLEELESVNPYNTVRVLTSFPAGGWMAVFHWEAGRADEDLL